MINFCTINIDRGKGGIYADFLVVWYGIGPTILQLIVAYNLIIYKIDGMCFDLYPLLLCLGILRAKDFSICKRFTY